MKDGHCVIRSVSFHQVRHERQEDDLNVFSPLQSESRMNGNYAQNVTFGTTMNFASPIPTQEHEMAHAPSSIDTTMNNLVAKMDSPTIRQGKIVI